MPPSILRKRQHSPAPDRTPSTPATKSASKRRKKETVFDALESQPRAPRSAEENKRFLSKQQDETSSDSDEDAENDSHDDMEFEDVVVKQAAKGKQPQDTTHDETEESRTDESSEDEIDWEDTTNHPTAGNADQPTVSGDLELTLDAISNQSVKDAYGSKKGPSKIERQIRTSAHCIHVQCLMYHNLIRNGWTCDKEAQKLLVDSIPQSIKQEVERWRRACGDTLEPQQQDEEHDTKTTDTKSKARKYSKKHKNQREWGGTAEELEKGAPNLSQGDPTVRLLKALSAWWRKRFTITAPGLRKQGFKDAISLQSEVKSFRDDAHDAEEHGERVQSREAFRKLAKKCKGSRDIGAQLFVTLLRGLGVESRLVASLQPLGFGWSKGEDAIPSKKLKKPIPTPSSSKKQAKQTPKAEITSEPPTKKRKTAAPAKASRPKTKPRGAGDRSAPIDLSDDSDLSDAPDSDTDSLIDITPPTPTTSVQKYDRDLEYPHYWAEVLSPTSQTWIPVDPIVLNQVASNDEALQVFEPRGAKADKAKQVCAYIIAYYPDGTAKDVTVRYLKRHMLPGKTKGMRMPIEKVQIRNKRGKVLRSYDYDWFGNVMKIYERPTALRTAADDIEDQRELKPVKPERKAKEDGLDTLQGLKSSAEFVLERHLRREEAIRAGAEPVRMLTVGKGDKAKEEPIFLRSDILTGKTVETWHKEGREIKTGEHPIKHVPFRAVTTIRKRELEEAERTTGEKQQQGLYNKDQTQFIVPPPIGPDRSIPKNTYGNMDVYVPSMVPKGAVHIPLKGTAKVCKKLQVDFAEACTGFDFGHRMAVPILTGVVVAAENEHMVIDAWEEQEEIKRQKEADKREKLALSMWKKFLNGLRIVKRIRAEYGDDAGTRFDDALSTLDGKKGKKAEPKNKKKGKGPKTEEDTEGATSKYFGGEGGGGGFLPEGMDVEEPIQTRKNAGGGGFFLDGQDDRNDEIETTTPISHPQTPMSLGSAFPDAADDAMSDAPASDDEPPKRKANGKQTSAKRAQPASRKRKAAVTPPDSTEDVEKKETEDGDEDTGDLSPQPKRRGRKSKTHAEPAQLKSKRGAARKSTEAVRSHYFGDDSDDD